MTGRRGVMVGLVVVLLASPGLAAAGGGVPTTDAHLDGSAGSAHVLSVDGSAQENNTTRHEHPDEVNERGNLADVESWLAGRLGERLARSSIQLSEGEYELARQFVGEAFRERYGQYVDVAGETATERDDDAADAFQTARDGQDDLVSQVRTFRETREAYEDAKAAGDEERARELARQLQRQAAAINGTTSGLLGAYRTISNTTDADMSEGIEAVEEIRENVSEQVVEVRREEFVATELSLSVAATEISFTSPLEATGRLVTANGTPVADRRVRFRIGERDVTTRTDEAGRFELTYRPTTVPVGEQTVAVRYVPENASVYLGSEAQVSVTVRQVQPRVELANEVDTVVFDERVVVNGSVAADGVGAAGVPVAVTLGDERLGQATTGQNGSFTVAGRVPATVAAGERTLSVRVPLEDRALASASARTAVQVETTDTRLALEDPAFESGEVRVDGRLTTDDGRPVPDGRIAVTLDGTTIGTVRTDGDGSFSSRLDVPGRLRPASGTVSLELVASFDGAGTNLEGSRDSAAVTIPAFDAGSGDGPGGEPDESRGPVLDPERLREQLFGSEQFSASQLALIGALAALLVAGGVFAWRRRGGDGEDESEGRPTGAGQDAIRDDAPAQALPEPTALDAAARRLEEGLTDAAVETAYAAVRRQVGDALDVAGARTHWEFLHASRDAGLNGDGYAALETLTEGYERAAFAPDAVPDDEAEQAIASARTLDGLG